MAPLTDEMLDRAETLIEALPYIREFYGKPIVVKYGGAAMQDESLKRNVMSDLILMKYVGMRPVLVHGGGPRITEMMERVGKKSEWVDGLRVSDEETASLAEMVLAGAINKEIVSLINRLGGQAVGLSGKDANLISARRHVREATAGERDETHVDLGFVGDITHVDPRILHVLDAEGFIPVIAGTSFGDKGETYNINADTAAGEVAAALRAEKLIVLTDVRGVLRDPTDTESLISTIRVSEIRALRDDGVFGRGMIPKVDACAKAVEDGVPKAHIIDGRIPHSLLLEVFTRGGIGTEIVPD